MKKGPKIIGPDAVSQAAYWCLRLADEVMHDRDRIELERWLHAGPDHPKLLAQSIEAWRAVEAQSDTAEMIPLRDEAQSQLDRAFARRRLRTNVQIAVASVVAALVVAGGVGGLWLAQAANTYATNVGERRVVVLSDGSRVTLDALTRVRVRYDGDRRQLWLEQGRAKFEVAKNPLRPFSVMAEGKLVVATGTQFSVELLRQQIRVDLYEGHVAVIDNHAQLAKAALGSGLKELPGVRYLAPGEELVASRQVGRQQIRPLNQGEAPTWEAGQLTFVDESLATVAEQANRYSEDKIVLDDESVGAQRISGVFTAGDTAALVTAITTILPVRAVENGGVVRLSITRTQNNRDDGGVR